jgi:uncharacterized membrane protein (Fun14 family)
VIRIAAVILGLFLGALAYLQFHEIATVNWDKLQHVSEGAAINLSNTVAQIPGIASNENTTGLALYNLGILLTSSMTMGFAIGFMKG